MKTLAIITGILTAILGFLAFTMPLRVFLGLGWILGVLFIINGVELIIGAFTKKTDIWQCILGVVVSIGGGILLFNTLSRVITDIALAYVAGFVIIAYGINAIVSGVKGMKVSKTAGICGIILGALSVLVGGFSLMHPFVTMISVGYIIATSVVIQGINMIVMAFAVGKIKKSVQEVKE